MKLIRIIVQSLLESLINLFLLIYHKTFINLLGKLYPNKSIEVYLTRASKTHITMKTSDNSLFTFPIGASYTVVRGQIGQNLLLKHGIPEIPVQCVLLPTLSLLKKLGIRQFFRFLADWRGQSLVHRRPVINYSIFRGK